ncbi:hypothetical protein D3C86_1525240 [compost metagenome]
MMTNTQVWQLVKLQRVLFCSNVGRAAPRKTLFLLLEWNCAICSRAIHNHVAGRVNQPLSMNAWFTGSASHCSNKASWRGVISSASTWQNSVWGSNDDRSFCRPVGRDGCLRLEGQNHQRCVNQTCRHPLVMARLVGQGQVAYFGGRGRYWQNHAVTRPDRHHYYGRTLAGREPLHRAR